MKKSLIAMILGSLVSLVLLFGLFLPSSADALADIKELSSSTAIVKAEYLNVRQGPSTEHNIVCVLKMNEKVEILGKYKNWAVVYNPTTRCVGFSSINYLKVIENKSNVIPKAKNDVNTKPKNIIKELPKQTPKEVPVPPVQTTPQVANKDNLTVSEQERYLLELINNERSKNNVGALKFDMGALKTSRLKAKDMVEKKYFSHQSPTYGSPFDMMKQFSVDFKTAGENIAGNRSLENAVKAWMNSEGHRKNILNGSFNYTGIGIVDSPIYGRILVQQFIGK